MKKKKNKWLIPLIGIVIVILLALILFTKAIPLGFLGNFSFLPFKLQFSAFGDDEDLPDSEEKEQEDDCSDLNIADEYRDFYGDAFINTARDSCNLNGIYREGSDISGCSFDKDSLTVDCTTPAMANLRTFCEKLDANWVCSNSQGFVGCVCDRSAPGLDCWWQLISEKTMILEAATWAVWYDDLPKGKYKFEWSFATNLDVTILEDPTGDDNSWSYDMTESGTHVFTEDENIDEWGIKVSNPWRSNIQITLKLYQWVCDGDVLDWSSSIFDERDYWSGGQEETYTCGQGTDNYCEGTCPEDYPYCEKIWFGLYEWACACSNYNDEVHPDWKEDGINHNPHDDTPDDEPPPDCIDEANEWGYDYWVYNPSQECMEYGAIYCWENFASQYGGGRIDGECCLFNCVTCEDKCTALGYPGGYYAGIYGGTCQSGYDYVAGTTQCCCMTDDFFCDSRCPSHGVSVATSGTGTYYADNWCVVNCGGEGYFGISTYTYDGINCYCWTCHNEQYHGWTC